MKIAPSVLAADFSNLECELKDIETGGADLVHLDVMDGTFVPNISFGPPVIQSLGKIGVDMISFQQEAVIHVDRTIHDIKSRGIKAGIALNPGTSLSALELVLPLLDFVLIMSVNPGFGGQKFISYTLDKIKVLKKMMKNLNLQIPIEVDGGVSSANAVLLKDAGADILVAGSSVFGAADRKKAIDVLRS